MSNSAAGHSVVGAIIVQAGLRQLALGPSIEVVVGREADCDIVLADGRASRHHLRLSYLADGIVLAEDLKSLNGTYVDGVRIDRISVARTTDIRVGAPDGPKVTVQMPTLTAHPVELMTESVIEHPGVPITVGRGSSNSIVLDDPLVSREHAELIRQGDRLLVIDRGSLNGVQINGIPTHRGYLGPDDVLTIGRTSFRLINGELTHITQRDASLVADQISFTLPNKRKLIDNVTFAVPGASLLAVIGPSGAGKSTLLKALTGSQPATSGRVIYNGVDLYLNYANLRQRIGVVPQDDVVHRQLTVRQALEYAAELRLPGDYTKDARSQEVKRVIADLDLQNHAETQISKLSGGQRKRASVALELLTQPNLLLLDEPTSGLDPNLDRSVMTLLRRQADAGRTVLVITHSVANLDMCDNVLILAPGGKVAYFGPPQHVLSYFGVADYADVFSLVADRPDQVAAAFNNSSLKPQVPSLPPALPTGLAANIPPPPAQPLRRQWSTLVRRQLRIVTSDRSYAISSVLLPLFIAVMALAIPGDKGFGMPVDMKKASEPSQLLVVSIVGCAFMGMSASIRELVAERAIFLRERAVGLSPNVYLLAKICVLFGLTALQSVLLISILRLGKPGPDHHLFLGGTAELMLAAFGTALASALIGLLLSALVGTSEQAMPALVLTVMFQLVMCGGLIQVSGRGVMEVISGFAPARWGYAMAASTIDLQTLNPLLTKDRLYNHHLGIWLISVGALVVLSIIAATGAGIKLHRQKSTT